MKGYRHQEIARLAHELSLSPLRHRLRQLAGIERTIHLIEPKRDYPYSFVCFQITGYRPRRGEDIVLGGKSLVEDLVRLADELTTACPLPTIATTGAVYDADALAARFNVSTKTISRWRKRGLVGLWHGSISTNGSTDNSNLDKPLLLFTQGAVERFVARHRDLVRRGAAFQLMGKAEKAKVIARARELVASEKCSLHTVTQRIAEETGRAVETIRYTLRRFDDENPDLALFDRREAPVELDENTVVFEAYSRGEAIADLAGRFDKSEREIRRILTDVRAKQLAEAPIAYMYNELFDAPDAEQVILGPEPTAGDNEETDITVQRPPTELPAYLKALYRTPLLTRGQEAFLFRQMNYLLHRAEQLRRRAVDRGARITPADIAAVDEQLAAANAVKNRITQANLRLVVSIAKRHLSGRNADRLFELVSDGNVALMRAVEKFDYARGFRFSTYASWAIMRSYARSIPEAISRSDRFQTGYEELLAAAPDSQDAEPIEEADAVRTAINDGLRGLDRRERTVIEAHFGIGRDGKSQTLDEIGRALGISKERVRQIEIVALRKLRLTMGDHGSDLLAG